MPRKFILNRSAYLEIRGRTFPDSDAPLKITNGSTNKISIVIDALVTPNTITPRGFKLKPGESCELPHARIWSWSGKNDALFVEELEPAST